MNEIVTFKQTQVNSGTTGNNYVIIKATTIRATFFSSTRSVEVKFSRLILDIRRR